MMDRIIKVTFKKESFLELAFFQMRNKIIHIKVNSKMDRNTVWELKRHETKVIKVFCIVKKVTSCLAKDLAEEFFKYLITALQNRFVKNTKENFSQIYQMEREK